MKNKGFTLVELMVVVVILIIIGGLVAGIGGGGGLFKKAEVFEGPVISCQKLDAQFAEGSQIFSFAVKMDIGDEYLTFSTEDRQFATVNEGDKIQVKVFKYSKWNREKAGTYHGGRLLKTYK